MTQTQAGLSVEDAKRIAQDTEDAIVKTLPTSMIASVEQRKTGILLPCGENREYQWTGRTIVNLAPSATVEDVVSRVLSAYSDNDELRPRDITDSSGPAIQLLGPYDSGYIVGRRSDDAVDVASFSPCFNLPEGESPILEY